MANVVQGNFSTDVTPPSISLQSPAKFAGAVLLQEPLSFTLDDLESGVNMASLSVTLDGSPIVISGVAQAGWVLGDVIVGTVHTVTLTHSSDFSGAHLFTVGISVSDFATIPNTLIDNTWTFTTEALPIVPVVAVFPPIGVLTEVGRHLQVRAETEGLVYGSFRFEVGGGGFLSATPQKPTEPLQTATALDDFVFGKKHVTSIEFPNDSCVCYNCDLSPTEANFELGEIAIYADILESPESPAEVGDVKLIAITHFPARFKTAQGSERIGVCVQL